MERDPNAARKAALAAAKKAARDAAIPPQRATRVQESDLGHIRDLLEMLRVLNDTLAGAPQIAAPVARIPSLRARVTRKFAARFLERDIPALAEQLAALGNREFEALLLAYLEDLTELKASLEP